SGQLRENTTDGLPYRDFSRGIRYDRLIGGVGTGIQGVKGQQGKKQHDTEACQHDCPMTAAGHSGVTVMTAGDARRGRRTCLARGRRATFMLSATKPSGAALEYREHTVCGASIASGVKGLPLARFPGGSPVSVIGCSFLPGQSPSGG